MASVEDARQVRRVLSRVVSMLPNESMSISNVKAKNVDDEDTRVMVVRMKSGGHVLCSFTPLAESSEIMLSEMLVPVMQGKTMPDENAVGMVVGGDENKIEGMTGGSWFEV